MFRILFGLIFGLALFGQANPVVRTWTYAGTPTGGDCTSANYGHIAINTTTSPDTFYDCKESGGSAAWVARTATRWFSILNGRSMPDTSGNVVPEPYTIKATNDFWGHAVFTFNDTSTDLVLHGTFEVPHDFISGAQACAYWTTTATSGNVVLNMPYRAVTGNDTTSLDQSSAGTTPTAVTAAAPGAANRRMRTCITLTDSDFTTAGTIQFHFQRNGTSGSDTVAAAITLHELELEYTGSR